MRQTENHTDWRELYETEINVANSELAAKNFRIDEASVVCDIYALPSHNHQTFFGRIVSERGIHKIVYAKAIQSSMWFSDPIYMYTFEEAKRFEDHPMKRGRIICRATLCEKSFIDHLLFNVWKLVDIQPDDTVQPSIDADFTAIRMYEHGVVTKSIFYTDASKLEFRGRADNFEAIKFLNKLHFSVENIIGIGEN